MKLIIAGGRTYQFTPEDIKSLDALDASSGPILEVVSGAAKGADEEGEKWAASRQIPVKRFPANWRMYGLRAGPIRNQEMADYADAVVLFPGGKGTQSMARVAGFSGLDVFDLRKSGALL